MSDEQFNLDPVTPRPQVVVPQLCPLHTRLLVQQLGFGPDDPWRALYMVATISLFQGITRFASTWERLGGDVTRISELGCLACYRPDVFGEIIYAGECGGDASAVFDAIKALSDGWLKEGREKSED